MQLDMCLSIWVMMLGCIPLAFGIHFIPLSNMIIFMGPKSISNPSASTLKEKIVMIMFFSVKNMWLSWFLVERESTIEFNSCQLVWLLITLRATNYHYNCEILPFGSTTGLNLSKHNPLAQKYTNLVADTLTRLDRATDQQHSEMYILQEKKAWKKVKQ